MLFRSEGVQAAGQKRQAIDWGNLYGTIGTQIRSALGLAKPTTASAEPPATPTTGMADREQRKAAAIVTLPTAAQRAAQPVETKPLTREEQLNAMRKARGQTLE